MPGDESFTWKDIQIQQNSEVFKISTDSLLLGSWVHRVVPKVSSIIDAGTGTGILALMMAYYYPEACVHAVDIDDHSVRLAQGNADRSRRKGQIMVRNENILKPSISRDLYDLVISNPPFYAESNLPKSSVKASTKHHIESPADWIRGLASRMHKDGHLCLVLPYNAVLNWITAANDLGLYVTHRLDVYSFPGDTNPIRALLHCTAVLQQPLFSSMTIYDADHKFSEPYISFTGIRPGKMNLLPSMEGKEQEVSSKYMEQKR